MNWTKFSISTVLGGVAYFLMGWLVYGFILRNAIAIPEEYASVIQIPPEDFRISWMIVSCLIYGAMLTIIMQWAKFSGLSKGLLVGAVIGVLVALTLGLSMGSMYKFVSLNRTLLDTVGTLICSGVAGGLIGWYLGRGK